MPHVGFKAVPISDMTTVGNSQLSTVVVMIESPTAIENIDSITSTEGVDVVLIGTKDQAIELGVPGDYDHATFIEGVVKVARSVKTHGKILGVAGIYNRPDILRKFIHEYGARFVLGHVDLPLVAKAAAETVLELQKLEDHNV